MPPRSRRLAFPSHSVTAVVVSHDGAAWLTECLDGLARQTRPPQRVVAVDTGSTDDSAELAAAAVGASAVILQPRDTGFGAAVAAGLAAFDGAPAPASTTTEWVWMLHDDCAPEPDVLAQLLARAADAPSVAAVVPKQLTWDRHHLLEVGVTVDSSGTRDTGLEPREVDHGQHDGTDTVLAGGTAGLLVRRDVWDRLDGLDRRWPLHGDDIDLGWRITAAGDRVVAAPAAVVRHVAALTHGTRRADATRLPSGAAARLHGMQVVLANTSPWLVLPLALRYLVEAIVRVVVALVVMRSPRRVRDELLALAALVADPTTVVRSRRRRAAGRRRAHRELRSLLAPPSRRWRHVVDRLGSGPQARARRTSREGVLETGPVPAEAESFGVDDAGGLGRLLSRPGVLLTIALLAVALAADRSLLGGDLAGGRLLPAARGASDLWHRYLESWHPVGLGSTSPAPPALVVLALLATVLLGKVWLAVEVLLLGAVPLAGIAAYVGAGGVTRRRGLRAAAGAAYALAPPVTGAVAGGRLDVIVVALVAPIAMRVLASAVRSGATARAFAAGLLLAVATAFAPVAWIVAVAGGAACVAAVARTSAGLRTLAVAAIVPLLVLLPWTWHVITTPRLLVAGIGLPEESVPRPSGLDLLALHAGGPAQPPTWLWGAVIVVGLLGVLTGRRASTVGVVGYVAAAAAAVVVSRRGYFSGAELVIAAAAVIAAAIVAAEAAPAALRRRAFGWRHAAAVVLALGCAGVIAATAVAWLVRGADQPLRAAVGSVLPVFAQAEAAAPTAPRVLLVRQVGSGIGYTLLRGPDALRLGDADVSAGAAGYRRARHGLDAAVADAVAARPAALGELAEYGVTLLVVRGSDAGLVTGLHGVDGLARVPATSSVVYRSSLRTGEAVLLHGQDAAAAGSGRPLPSTARPQPLPAAPGSVRTTVPPASSARLLVLAQPHSAAWQATLDGRRLAPTTAYGWAQAWSMPATGGELRIRRVGDARGSWLVAEAVLVAVALLSCVPLREDA